MATVNRILVDSRFRKPDSISTADFRVELSETISVDDAMCCVVTDICIPISWYTVETHVNDKNVFFSGFSLAQQTSPIMYSSLKHATIHEPKLLNH